MLALTVNPQRHQRGLSLIEMMVALTIGMIVVVGAFVLTVSSMSGSRDNIRMATLNQELRNVMGLVSNDIRRAGAWSGAVDAARVSTAANLVFGSNTAGSSTTLAIRPANSDDVSNAVIDSVGNLAATAGATVIYREGAVKYTATITAYDSGSNTFTATLGGTAFPSGVLQSGGGAAKGTWTLVVPGNTITTMAAGTAVTSGDADCIIFNYDVDRDGTPDNIGFRHDATNTAVETKSNSTCTGTAWEDVTAPSTVAITAFNIKVLPATMTVNGFTIKVNEYRIDITGNLVSDPSVVRSLRETIRVRNDSVS